MLVPLEPLMDVALDPVVYVPVEPITGALGATGALLGAVPPLKVLRGLANGAQQRMSAKCQERTHAAQQKGALRSEPPSRLGGLRFLLQLFLAIPVFALQCFDMA